jgi:hypothetical protein
MKPSEFFERIVNEMQVGGDVITLSPGPIQMQVSEHDRAAMQLILDLIEKCPDVRVGDTIKVLDAARWWAVFWASMPNENDLPERTEAERDIMYGEATRANARENAAIKRAEAAEARVEEMDGMLDMLPEYLEYWDACDGPALSLSEWYVYKDGYQE